MRKITEKEYYKWVERFEDESNVIFSLLNVIDNQLHSDLKSSGLDSVARGAIACNARLLEEKCGIKWQGFFNWKEMFEEKENK